MARLTPDTATESEKVVRTEDDDLPPIHFVTPEEGRRMFDEAVRKYMGISGEEFLRRLDAGEYYEIADKPGHRHIVRLALMRSLAEQES